MFLIPPPPADVSYAHSGPRRPTPPLRSTAPMPDALGRHPPRTCPGRSLQDLKSLNAGGYTANPATLPVSLPLSMFSPVQALYGL